MKNMLISGRFEASQAYLGLRNASQGIELYGQPQFSQGKRLKRLGESVDDGLFVEWAWDGRQLVVANDRYGLYPLFYSHVGDEFWVSPTLTGVLRGNSKRRYNKSALAVFFRFGQFLGDDTPFDDVHLLPPNSVLTWSDGVLTLDSRAPIRMQAPTACHDLDGATDAYIDLFAASIALRLPSDEGFTVPISGGRDSRHILLELAKQGHAPRSSMTVKYRPPSTNEDFRIAKLLTTELGIQHVQLERPPSFFRAGLRDVFMTNYCGGGHGWIQPVAEYLAGRYHTTYDGLAGDELSALLIPNDPKLKMFRSGRLEDLAIELLNETKQEQANRNILNGELYRSLPFEMAVQRMVLELERHVDAPSPVVSFNFWNRTRRCIASIPMAILSAVPLVHCPFLDHKLFDFLVGLDPDLIAGKALHDVAILRAYPDFAHIPFEDKSRKAVFTKPDRYYYRRARFELLQYLLRRRSVGSSAVNLSYLLPKSLIDILRNVAESPWYMRTALYAIELQALQDHLEN